MLQKVVNELHTKKLKNFINLKEDPEIKEMKDASESDDDIMRLTPQEWLKRWLNNRLGKSVNTPIEDYTETIYAVMKVIDPAFATSAPVETFNTDPTIASQHMVCNIQHTLHINNKQRKIVRDVHLGEIKIARIVRGTNVRSKKWLREKIKKQKSARIVLCRLLDKMKPGCIHWKAVQLKPRQKFDKIGNCSYAMGVCGKEFPFSLVGIGGEDVHNGNQKMIQSLLWQMMRYWSTKKLSELSFGGKDVKDEDILQWANLTISGLRDRHSSEIRSFKDKKLTTAIFYLELLKVVLGEEHVRDDLIYFNIPILSNPRAPDEHSKERLANARYAMTIIRMNGADLFILPEDLIALDNKAVLSTLAAIMTIAFTQDKIDHDTHHDEDKIWFTCMRIFLGVSIWSVVTSNIKVVTHLLDVEVLLVDFVHFRLKTIQTKNYHFATSNSFATYDIVAK
ncbi:hypothetical protein RFI_34658 [Reticulomyxa filosa]|uniref:Calponin-homology (CH) domain-containing protein n=1 Tax=Reticulomyxa filosa TaxID=46433 RepID=X6LPT4_RETFI|nr:hypothetical protein RFI_34658 [Reticulomyxa filosa]|eukprot:ETO02755.1 hypothetical protein RFI_34658 [Reticulomyxa filosa]